MYYPYFRARQFELIALRELVFENMIQRNIVPVLEPVKKSLNNLTIAHRVFVDNSFSPFFIVNPIVGELPGDTQYYIDYITSLENSHFRPAFLYHNNAQYIANCIQNFNLQNCMLVCYENFNDDNNLREICNNHLISHIMVLEPNKYRGLDRFIKGLDKTYIRLDDVFEKQSKNADFLNISAHKFSEEHLYFAEDHYHGFSDFTVLPSEYVDGGSTPRAVAIHLTYVNRDSDNEIWIRHFTSESNDSIANVQGKFAEAAQKAIDFCNAFRLNNSAITELREYYNNGRYPGLGTVKKISIKNHLHIVNDFLIGNNG
jgi:hypothetical protein